MIVSRALQVFLATIPFFGISIGVTTLFLVNNIGIYAMFPTVLGGLFPLIVVASNKYEFLPPNATKFQSFRLFIGAVCWATITTSSIMIAFLVRLLNSYNFATFSIQFFSYSIVAAIISLVAIFSQQFAEIIVRPLFLLEEEEEEEDAKELDDLFLLQENMVYKKMETQIVKSRATAVSHASNCAAFSIVALFIGFAFCFPMKTFDIFEQPVFTVPCINQQIINNLQNVSMGFKSNILTESLCSYSPCAKQDCYSFEPTLPPYLISNPSSPIVLADNGLTLEKGCQTFSLIQTCDSLGFRGLVGSFQVGKNCTCAPIADNQTCKMHKNAPQPYNLLNVYGAIFVTFIWITMSRNRMDLLLWKTLLIRCTNLFRNEERFRLGQHDDSSSAE